MEGHRIEDLLKLKNIENVIIDSTGKHIAALAGSTYRDYKKKEFNKYIYILKEDLSTERVIQGTGVNNLFVCITSLHVI